MSRAALSLARPRRGGMVDPAARDGAGKWITVGATRAAPGGRRQRGGPGYRSSRVTVRYSPDEMSALAAAAERAGLALAAYIAQASLDAAENRAVPVATQHRDLLAELLQLGVHVRRAGTHLARAAERLQASGVPGPELAPAAAYMAKVAQHIDDATLRARRRLAQ